MSEFDMSILNDRINTHKREMSFYISAIEMLIEEYKFNSFLTKEEIVERFPELPSEFLLSVLAGVTPTTEELLRLEHSQLDHFVQDALFMCGFVYGINDLESEGDVTSEFIQFLYDCRNDVHLVPVGYGFAALSLAMNRAPSYSMLMRFFPPSVEDKTNIETFDIITELNGDLVIKYQRHREGAA